MATALKSFAGIGATFTVGDIASQVIGSSGTETVRLQENGSSLNASLNNGTNIDANIENIELRGNYSDYKFLVNSGAGLVIQKANATFGGTAGNVVATIPNINQTVKLKFFDGYATLTQTGSNVFKLNGGTAISTSTAEQPSLTLTNANAADSTTVTYTAGTANTPTSSGGVSKSFVTGGTANTAATAIATVIGGTAVVFTVADHDVAVKGGTGGNEVVRIQAGVTGVTLDANIERIELSGALATYKFLATAGIGLRIYEIDGTTLVATIPSINQAVKIAFTDGSAALVQTAAAAFTLNTVAVAVGASGATTPTLTGGTALVTTTGERSVLGLHITATTGASDATIISTAFTQYVATSGTSDTAATVVATGMSSTEGGQLDTVAIPANIAKIATGGITGVMALASGQDSTELTALFGKYSGTTAEVVATSMTTQVEVLATHVAKIADDKITGSISLSGTEFGTLTAKIAGGTAATLTVTDTSLAATVLTAMDTKSDNAVNAANLTTITGLTAEVKAVTDTLATIVVGTVTSGVSNAAATLSDSGGVTLAATNLSAIGAKTSGIVTVTNAVVISGTTAEVTAALVTVPTLVVAGTALVTLNDAAFASSNVTVAATALSAIGVKTSGAVTVSSAVKIVGNTADVTAALVTTETLVVAATALVTTSNTGSVADVNAILGKTSGIVTAAVTAGTASALDSTLTNATVSTTDALTLTLNDTTGVTITLLNSLNDKTSVNVVATSLTEVLGTTVGGGAAADTIDLNAAGITYHATDMISIKGGVGDDVLTGRANAPDTFVIGNTGADGQIITINNFNGTNDILSFFTDAILNVKMDSDDADGTQEIQATSFSNTGNATFTVKLMGLTNAQDANLFNMDSFNTLFGKTGRDGDDVITGTGGNDTITGGLGVDAMTGDAGDDTLIYALTADLFNTKAVVDTITGGDGIDVISVGTNGTTFAIANDDIWTRVNTVETIKAVANTEAVTIALSVSAETAGIRTVDLSLTSHPTGNVINVSTYSAATTLIGGSGADVITGGAGADVITGGLGVDAMTGGASADTFVFAPGVTDTAAATSSVAGIDKITDLVLNAATADLIDLTVTVANVNTAIATGLANAATFVSDMNTLVNVGSSVGFNTGMNSDISAVLVTLNAGDQSGKTFLLVDLDGSDTFTATDFIIDVTGITATSVTTASFV